MAMKVLWICNIMLPAVARHLNLPSSNKEGWLTGLASVIQERSDENDIELAVAFPVTFDPQSGPGGCRGEALLSGKSLKYYGFYEDTVHPQNYDDQLEERLKKIMEDFRPDVVHCFGTEFGHTLAASRVCPDKDKLLIGIQGLCSVYAGAYMANLPVKVIRSVTFRDLLKKDSMLKQQKKYVIRGQREIEAIRNAGNITGRTHWDAFYSNYWNESAEYFVMNETLRPDFYHDQWNPENGNPHRIFVSQGDYPLKGLHYLLLALPIIRSKYPDVTVHVAGNSLVNYHTLKDKIKISAYGKYLRSILKKYQLQDIVTFLGSLTAEQMKAQYLEAGVFLCCSSMENSPNSLGEAMLLGVPCVSANVGGIASIFRDGEDGILFQGFAKKQTFMDYDHIDYAREEKELEGIVQNLADAVIRMWSDAAACKNYCKNARKHAKQTHNKEENYKKLLDIYAKIGAK